MFDFEKFQVFFRGEFVPFEKATISIANTGFLYGLGVFTGMRAHRNPKNGKLYIFRPQDHYERLYNSCRLFRHRGFMETYSYKQFVGILKELFVRNSVDQDAYIRVTNFSDENKISPKFVGYKDSLAIFLYPLGDYVKTTGMRCCVASWTRTSDNSIPARAKINGLYVNTAFAKTDAIKDGYDEAIFLDDRGRVVEGSAENIFLVIGDTLVTPSPATNILEGITRRTVMELAAREGLKIVERDIARTELYKADEVILTGTGARVSPVIEIDQIAIGKGVVGPVSQLLQERYAQVIIGELPGLEQWVEEV